MRSMAKESEIVNPVTEADGSNVEPAVHKREREASEGTLLDEEAKKQKTGTSSRGGDAEGKETGRDSSAVAVSGESKRNGCAKDKQSVVLVEQDRAFEIEAGAAEDKGSRHSMEDAWIVLPNGSLDTPGKLRCSHFAIYDGHGGRLAAEYAQKHLHRNVLAAGLPRELLDVKAAKRAILDGFWKTDESLLQESASGGWQDGATAVCVWVLGQTAFIANIGDAKAVLARSSTGDASQKQPDGISPLKSIVLTREHKAIYPQERARIQKAGGSVSSNGRLQGRLEVSRAFGDRQFKKVGVVATPDIHSFEITEREHFMILGCDGLWGVFGPSDAVEFVQKLLKEGLNVTAVSRRLVREAVLERRCKDNCTAIVITFSHKQ